MTMRTIQLEELVVPLRRGFEPLTNSDGVPQADRDGQPLFAAEAVVPGKLASRFADTGGPDLVRIRVAGHNPGHGAGANVRLHGKVLLTAWYTPRARGSDARSDITISAQFVGDGHKGSAPAITGGLAAILPPGTYLGQDGDQMCSVMLPPEGVHTVDGLASVRVRNPVPDELLMAEVVPVGLRAFFFAPDREDVSNRAKAELILVAHGFERVASSNGKPRKADETPAEVTA